MQISVPVVRIQTKPKQRNASRVSEMNRVDTASLQFYLTLAFGMRKAVYCQRS